MLNPTFPQTAKKRVTSPYVLDKAYAQATVAGNEAMHTGAEYRLQSVYGDELWCKLEHAGLAPAQLAGANILEVCAGTGLLTYHLLERCKPASLTVNYISPQEVAAAQALLVRSHPEADISWVLGDMHQVVFQRKFDVIIGNSFLHHFHDVPKVLTRFAELLSEGGGIYLPARTHPHEHGGGGRQAIGLPPSGTLPWAGKRHCPGTLQGATKPDGYLDV
jgi:ubiquinone/menaquinone biosynthesis C-methylase UbiE